MPSPWGKAFPAGDEVTPPYIAILPQSFLPRPYPINVRARRALRIYYLLSFIYYLLSILPRRGTLVPDGAPIRTIPGNRKKNSLTISVRLYFGAPSGTRTQDPLIKSQLLSQVTSAKSSFESSYCCFKTQFF